jgi:BASS family bile acid:Na+ symporter
MRPGLVEILRVVVATYLVAMMFSMGLELGGRPAEEKRAKRRERRLLIRGLVFNLAVLPLLAVTLTRAVHASGDVAIAFLLLAASPGGRFAPHLAKLADADLGLSVEMTLYLAKSVALTMPITAARMLHMHRVELHELKFILQLLGLQLLPYLFGRLLRRHREPLAARLARPLGVIQWGALLAVFALILFGHALSGVVAITSDRGWLAVLLFAIGGALIGWLLGGPSPEARRSFVISANARDLALALIVANQAFSARNVQLATVAVWGFFMLVNAVFVEVVRHRPIARPAHAVET